MRVKKYYYLNDFLVDEFKFFSRLVELSKINNKIDDVLVITRLKLLMTGEIVRIPLNFNKNCYDNPLLYYYFKISFIIEKD